jgi:hypothetical protein
VTVENRFFNPSAPNSSKARGRRGAGVVVYLVTACILESFQFEEAFQRLRSPSVSAAGPGYWIVSMTRALPR